MLLHRSSRRALRRVPVLLTIATVLGAALSMTLAAPAQGVINLGGRYCFFSINDDIDRINQTRCWLSVVNQEQNVHIGRLDAHGTRLKALETKDISQAKSIKALEGRATNLESRATQLEALTAALATRVSAVESRTTALETRRSTASGTQNETDAALSATDTMVLTGGAVTISTTARIMVQATVNVMGGGEVVCAAQLAPSSIPSATADISRRTSVTLGQGPTAIPITGSGLKGLAGGYIPSVVCTSNAGATFTGGDLIAWSVA